MKSLSLLEKSLKTKAAQKQRKARSHLQEKSLLRSPAAASSAPAPAPASATLATAEETPTRPTKRARLIPPIKAAPAPQASPATAPAPFNPFTDPRLGGAYELSTQRIHSGSSMEKKIQQVVGTLSRFSWAQPGAKPALVAVYAEGKAASKAVGVVEIVKRQIGEGGGTWFQYSMVRGEAARPTGVVKQKLPNWGVEKEEVVDVDVDMDAMDLEEDAAFEVMRDPPAAAATAAGVSADAEGKQTRGHEVPVIVIYLSRVRVKELKGLYG
ncbi:MAG: hypothetical protein M1829_003759 [Trizodia sp. TS-e1964]|nr:MAG: hypothetical protein M1829_003759 [Trizodia sp. TS-e1964]